MIVKLFQFFLASFIVNSWEKSKSFCNFSFHHTNVIIAFRQFLLTYLWEIHLTISIINDSLIYTGEMSELHFHFASSIVIIFPRYFEILWMTIKIIAENCTFNPLDWWKVLIFSPFWWFMLIFSVVLSYIKMCSYFHLKLLFHVQYQISREIIKIHIFELSHSSLRLCMLDVLS